jgi:hypothetical protein
MPPGDGDQPTACATGKIAIHTSRAGMAYVSRADYASAGRFGVYWPRRSSARAPIMDPHQELTKLLDERATIEREIDVLQHRHSAVTQKIEYARRHLARSELPCWTCPQGEETRFLMNSNYDLTAATSPSGLPLSCCRLRCAASVPILEIGRRSA